MCPCARSAHISKRGYACVCPPSLHSLKSGYDQALSAGYMPVCMSNKFIAITVYWLWVYRPVNRYHPPWNGRVIHDVALFFAHFSTRWHVADTRYQSWGKRDPHQISVCDSAPLVVNSYSGRLFRAPFLCKRSSYFSGNIVFRMPRCYPVSTSTRSKPGTVCDYGPYQCLYKTCFERWAYSPTPP